jgi:hypothetical protein
LLRKRANHAPKQEDVEREVTAVLPKHLVQLIIKFPTLLASIISIILRQLR